MLHAVPKIKLNLSESSKIMPIIESKNKKDANSVIGVFQEVLIKLYYIPILLYIEGQDDIY